MDYSQIITIDPAKRPRKPCVRGLRITVHNVPKYLARSMSVAEIVRDFRELTTNDVRACLAIAVRREHRLTSITA